MAPIYFFLSSQRISIPSFTELPCGKHLLWRSPTIHAFVLLPLVKCDSLFFNTLWQTWWDVTALDWVIWQKWREVTPIITLHYVRPHLNRPERETDFPFVALKKGATMLWKPMKRATWPGTMGAVSWPTTSKKMRTSNNHRKWSMPTTWIRMETDSSSASPPGENALCCCLDSSLVRSWAENPAKPRPDSWLTETVR